VSAVELVSLQKYRTRTVLPREPGKERSYDGGPTDVLCAQVSRAGYDVLTLWPWNWTFK